MERLFWVCLSGALGTGARYLVGLWSARRFGESYPVGTLTVNVVGCLLMGAVMHAALSVTSLSPTVRVAIATGFLGGLTTYSSFCFETVRFARNGAPVAALGYVALTTAACMCALLLGGLAARGVLGR